MNPSRFNIRVYFLLIKDDQILVSDELILGKPYTKFPGGGLEFGEGTVDCVRREALEEMGVELAEIEHFYTTDFFQQSYFRKEDQVLSIYYKVKTAEGQTILTSTTKHDFNGDHNQESFRLVKLDKLNEEEFSFPIDKVVVEMINDQRLTIN